MSDTTFVVMYHPALGNVQVDAPLQAVSTYQSHGWLLLDPNATAPPVASPYLSQPAADSRYLRDWAGAEVLTAGAVRVAPDGHVIVRVADGTTRSTYDATEAALWTALGGANDPALRAAYGALPKVAATVTASGALVVNKHNPVDATSGARTMTLPASPAEGDQVSIEKTDASLNAVTITGSVRGVGSSTVSLPWQNEALLLRADSSASWWPVAGHKTKASLDTAYMGAFIPERYGAKGDLIVGATGNITTGTAILTDSSANFTGADVGKTILVGITGYSSVLVTTILSRQSATQVTLSANAASTVTNGKYAYGTDDTAAFTAMIAALPTNGAARVLLGKAYLVPAGGLTFPNRVKIEGLGGGSGPRDDGTVNPGVGTMTGIIVTSATANGIVIGDYGSTLLDFGVAYLGSATPTAGSGVLVNAGIEMDLRNVSVTGFWNNYEFAAGSGNYWTATACKSYEPVHYGVYIHNTTPNTDHGDQGWINGVFANVFSPNQAVAHLRWESGGGLKVIGNKFNCHTTGALTCVDVAVADGVATTDIQIQANSIENYAQYGIQIRQAGTTGQLGNVHIVANQLAAQTSGSTAGIYVHASSAGQVANISNVIIGSNRFSTTHTTGIWLQYCNQILVEPNHITNCTSPITIEKTTQDVTVLTQHMGEDNHDYITDNRTLGEASQTLTYRDRIDWTLAEPFSSSDVNTWHQLFLVTLPQDSGTSRGSAALLELDVAGYNDSVGPILGRYRRTLVVGATGNVTVANPDASDPVAGAGQFAIQFTTPAAGQVSVQYQSPTGATNANIKGQTTLRLTGLVAKLHRGT